MIKLRIISLFLALVMTIQMLPMEQIGYALSTNLWTEELPHSTSEEVPKSDCGMKNFLPEPSHQFRSDFLDNSASNYIHRSEQTPTNHSTDIVSPPPDMA